MKSALRTKPRAFTVGTITINDWGAVQLEPNEMVSIQTPSGRSCDITVTDWGLYLGSSLDARMRAEGFRVALVENAGGKHFLNAVERDKLPLFEAYLRSQGSKIIAWLDDEISDKRP